MGAPETFSRIRSCIFGFAPRSRRRRIRRIKQRRAIPIDPSAADFPENSSFSAIQFCIISDLRFLRSRLTDRMSSDPLLLPDDFQFVRIPMGHGKHFGEFRTAFSQDSHLAAEEEESSGLISD
ncbi:hypothetical protein CEXT_126951 [Caerostris extrusa]|uniref:Uncharacterized protein n=1 Tax=Caerostris extrusa TaxID=172846 RepID=A0AAV4VTI4_CAEEX|nr:hypothetical protein CEXT_126951 [Caerostris extrusa]